MTNEQKEAVTVLRGQGYSYAAIAKATGLSKDSIKGFCRYHALPVPVSVVRVPEPPAPPEDRPGICPNCGAPVGPRVGLRERRFCSQSCCRTWWNAHPKRVQRKAIYAFICPGCGKAFTAYGNKHRKYCSHACYVAARFKGGDAQ